MYSYMVAITSAPFTAATISILFSFYAFFVKVVEIKGTQLGNCKGGAVLTLLLGST
jgi:hypothetical protein